MRVLSNRSVNVLCDFLLENQAEILAVTERKSLEIAGNRASSDLLKQGLPIFFRQLVTVLKAEPPVNKEKGPDVAAMAKASNRPGEVELAREAGHHGGELLRLGYTLSHVVHAYGAMCQSITEIATQKNAKITANEFHDLNRCLDVAIAGAVTEYQTIRNSEIKKDEVTHLGFLAHELRNTLTSLNISFELMQKGTVGLGGSTAAAMKKGLKRLERLIDRSLTEVRLRIDPEVHLEKEYLFRLIDQIVLTAEVEADAKNQTLSVIIDPKIVFEADLQLIYSAVSNLIQNAIKYTPKHGSIQIRGSAKSGTVLIEVEDQCGGLNTNIAEELFKPFEQQNDNRAGLGLGLTIARRALQLNSGDVRVENLPGRGCIFKISVPEVPPTKKRLPNGDPYDTGNLS